MNVLHYRDGSTTQLASPPAIDLERQVVVSSSEGVGEVPFSKLKAVFFLNDEQQPGDDADTKSGSFLVVEFFDGEVIRGNAHYNPASPGFFLYPVEKGRNKSVFVVTNAVESIEIEKV